MYCDMRDIWLSNKLQNDNLPLVSYPPALLSSRGTQVMVTSKLPRFVSQK